MRITEQEVILLAATEAIEQQGYAAASREFGGAIADQALAVVVGPTSALPE